MHRNTYERVEKKEGNAYYLSHGIQFIVYRWIINPQYYLLNELISIEDARFMDEEQADCHCDVLNGNAKRSLTLQELHAQHVIWTGNTFPEATAKSSLAKLRSEVDELEKELDSNSTANVPEEYVDVLMCLFDSAARYGLNIYDLTEAFQNKLEKNKSRQWVKNPDNTYSHVKKENSHCKESLKNVP